MTKSLWKAKGKKADFPMLIGEIETDIAIVGGGITGITSAYLLTKSGRKVVVLESREISGSTTGNSTGNLYAMVDKRLHHVQSKWDKETAGAVAKSRAEAVDLIERLAREHQIECNFKRVPWILFNETSEKDETIEKERAAAADYGLEVQNLSQMPIPIPVHSAIKVDNQAQFNPSAFVNGMAAKIDTGYGSIYENSPVQEIKKGEKKVLITPQGKVTANKVIMATHTPKGVYGLHTVVAPYREYAIAAKLRSGDFPDGIFWDTDAEHHHSLRSYKTEKDNYILIVGGHHKVGQASDHEMHYKKLEEEAHKFFDIVKVEYRWSAQHYKPSDGLPYIGESHEDDIFVATGFSTDGLTYGVLSAMIFDDLLNGRENKWAKTYEAKRFTPVKSAKEFIKENVNVMKEYVRNLPGQADAESFSEVKPGEGKVVESDDGKLAVYKDEVGKVHCVSAVCTHLYCIVDWNNAEKSWDCPCHGSRFEVDGDVIEGPALAPLSKIKTSLEK